MPHTPLVIAQMLESGGPGGAETVLLQLSDELMRRGHRVVPIRYRDGETWLDGQLRERELEPLYLPLKRAVDPAAVSALRGHLHTRGVHVVHSHEFTMAVYGAAATRRMSLRHVVTMHGNQTMTDAWRRRMALRWAFRQSHAVAAVSRATRTVLESRLGSRAGRILTIPNGIPSRPGDARGPTAEFGIRPDEVVVLAVGNLVPRKGHILLLQSLAILEEQGLSVPWRVIIAGRGEERERLEAFAREAGIADRVHLPGHRDDVPDLQAAAHILCMPSLWEGLPLAVLEGMHAGNCVVASDSSGIPEAIDDGRNGLLVPPGEVEPLAGALRRVLEDRDLRERLAREGLETARTRFSVAAMADRYEKLYRGEELPDAS
ncbi:MAG: glycosyltransferase family 4 protein [Longimicrobiales bacterium]